jgi:predicted hotdog family 3-hydroxylacyl-ACP dehydratase
MTPAPDDPTVRPPLMDHDGIAKRVPHAGTMCLLDALHAWDDDHIVCSAISHTDPHNPLRSQRGLLASAAIEYAAQAMALHGGLIAERLDAAAQPVPGFIAAARGVKLHQVLLHGLPSPLIVEARRNMAQGDTVIYDFKVTAGPMLVAEGRATVMLNRPLAAMAPQANPGAAPSAH